MIVTCFHEATVNILASDDGHGVISFNTSEQFLLREPTSLSGLSQSVASLFVARHPEDGTFGTVTVEFTITNASGSLAEGDVMPTQGFVVLEDGVRFKVWRNRVIWKWQYIAKDRRLRSIVSDAGDPSRPRCRA